MRRTDLYQLYLVGFGLMFLVFVVALTAGAQTQDAINATMFERMNAVTARLDRIENYTTAGVLAMIANFVAHLLQIRSQRNGRQRDEDDH